MDKILVFGLGFQGKKYVHHFYSKGKIIDCVSKSGINKDKIFGINKIFAYAEILDKDMVFFEQYNIIIVAVNPYVEQDAVIQHILSLNIQGRVIIEKPVSYSVDLLNILELKDNYYYYIDEIVLGSLYKKIFKKIENDITFVLYDCGKDNYKHTLEHAIAPFLLFEEFDTLLGKIKILFGNKNKSTTLYYKILYKYYLLHFYRGELQLNSKIIYNIDFSQSIDFLLSIDKKNNLLFKNNFKLLRTIGNY